MRHPHRRTVERCRDQIQYRPRIMIVMTPERAVGEQIRTALRSLPIRKG
jgi:hypothetical protein